jgi:glycosyltransferase involved in cell wall biosynthesis
VLTSTNEGSPVSLIEAMAAARPVVATAVGGVPDLVRDGEQGLLVPPGDPSATAEAIVGLLRDGARRRAMGAAGRRRVREAYTVERLVSDIGDLYTDLVATSSRPVPGRASGFRV